MIRLYTDKDKPKIIELFQLNTPEYFAPSEQSDFEYYLDNELEDYFVYEKDGKIIGAGGINYFTKEKHARISWDMIAPKFQGKGIGKQLTQHRIRHLNQNPEVDFIEVRTSQFAYSFYEKLGFTLEKIEKDFWAKNFDLYQMKMEIKNYA